MPEQLSPEAYETHRAALVRELGLMDDDGSQEAYDRIARLAKRIFGTEIVLITFMDSDRQWFKSHLGADMTENRRDQTFCTHTIAQKSTLVVEDASTDPRFRDNPFVLGGPQIRFYAGELLNTHDGHPVGTICLVDHHPRPFSQQDRDTLRDLADLVMTQVRVDRDLTYRDAATKMPNRIQFFADLRDVSRVHNKASRWVIVVELIGMPESNEAVQALGLEYLYDQIAHAAKVLRSSLPDHTIYHVGPTHLAFCLAGEDDAHTTFVRLLPYMLLEGYGRTPIPEPAELHIDGIIAKGRMNTTVSRRDRNGSLQIGHRKWAAARSFAAQQTEVAPDRAISNGCWPTLARNPRVQRSHAPGPSPA